MKSLKETRDELACEYYDLVPTSPSGKHVRLTGFSIGFDSGASTMWDKIFEIMRSEKFHNRWKEFDAALIVPMFWANLIIEELKKEE